jgi:hypothetical protein
MSTFGIVWLGMYLSLNQTAPLRTPMAHPGLAAEATSIVGVGKLTVTVIYIQPVNGPFKTPLLSIGVGIRVF